MYDQSEPYYQAMDSSDPTVERSDSKFLDWWGVFVFLVIVAVLTYYFVIPAFRSLFAKLRRR